MNAGSVIRNSNRETLLDAAQAIVTERGVPAMTLENVAALAGVTKGGLIYHYKTRELLLQALIERIVEQIESRYQAEAAKQGQTLEALLIAMIDDTFAMSAVDKVLMRNLLAAVSNYPNQLGPVQRMYERVISSITRQGEHSGLALMVSCALDGLVFLELLNIKLFSKDERARMRQALIDAVKRDLQA